MDDLGVGLVGHSGPKRVISNTLAAGKLGHASLLVGPSGVGRKLFARGIGKYLLCHRNQESGGIRHTHTHTPYTHGVVGCAVRVSSSRLEPIPIAGNFPNPKRTKNLKWHLWKMLFNGLL